MAAMGIAGGLALSAWAATDLADVDMTVTSLVGDEVFENTSETAATLTLDLADDVTWTGSVSGPVNLVKTGMGTLTVDGDGYQGTGGISISNGILKLGTNCGSRALGAAGTEVTIAEGGQLDMNYPAVAGDTTLGTPAHDTITHDIILHMKGTGPDGKGAVVNTGAGPWKAAQLGRIVLDGDTTLGYGKRLDIEAKTTYTSTYDYNDTAYLTDNGAGYTLTVANADNTQESPITVYSQEIGLMTAATVSVSKVRIENGGCIGLEGNNNVINAPQGIELGDRGQIVVSHRYHGGCAPIIATDGTSAFLYGRGTINVTNTITVREGATLLVPEYNGGSNVGYGNFNAAVTNDGTIMTDTRKNAMFKGNVVNRGTMTFKSATSGFTGAKVENSGTINLNHTTSTFTGGVVTNTGTINLTSNGYAFKDATIHNTGSILAPSTTNYTPYFSNVTFTAAGTISSTKALMTFYGYLKSPNEDFTLESSNRGIDFHADAVTLGGHKLTLRTGSASIWFGGGVKQLVADGPVLLDSAADIDVRSYATSFPNATRVDAQVPAGKSIYFDTYGRFADPTGTVRTAYLNGGPWHFPDAFAGLGFFNMLTAAGYQPVRTVVTNADWNILATGGIRLGFNGYEADVAFGAGTRIGTRVVQFDPTSARSSRLTLENGGELTLTTNESGVVVGFYLPNTYQRSASLVLNEGTLKAGSDWGIWYKRRDSGNPKEYPPYWGMDVTVGSRGDSTATLDLNGHDVGFTAGLRGLGSLAVTGDGNLRGNTFMQGRLAGSVSVEGTGVKDISGAATMSNLTVAAGAAVKLGVGGTNCVKMAYMDLKNVGLGKRDQGVYDNMDEAMAYDGDFPYRPTSLSLVHGKFTAANGDLLADGSAAIYEGQFYAPTSDTYTFAGMYNNGIELKIDGARVFQSVGYDQSQSGTCELTEGWHDFRVVVMNMGGAGGGQDIDGWHNAGMGLAWTNAVVDAASISNAPTGLIRFDTDTLAMRPNAPLVPTAGLVNWKHAPYAVTGEPTKEQILQAREWDTDTTTNSFRFINVYNDKQKPYAQAVNDFSGWFFVPEGDAGSWMFSVGFDNAMYFWLDDNPGVYVDWYPVTNSYSVVSGWHKFRIRTVDNGGNVGCWRNGNCTVRAKKPGGSFVAFDERNFTFRASMDDLFDALPNGIAGDLTLGTGSVVSNVSATGGCPVRGTISGAGTLAGQWLLTGDATLTYADVPKTVRDLGDYGPRFTDAQAALFRHGGHVTVAFAEQPMRQNIKVCPAGGLEGLSSAELAARITCTVAGGTATWFEPGIKDGWLYLNNLRAGATTIIFR